MTISIFSIRYCKNDEHVIGWNMLFVFYLQGMQMCYKVNDTVIIISN
jgi:hypothetical protein